MHRECTEKHRENFFLVPKVPFGNAAYVVTTAGTKNVLYCVGESPPALAGTPDTYQLLKT